MYSNRRRKIFGLLTTVLVIVTLTISIGFYYVLRDDTKSYSVEQANVIPKVSASPIVNKIINEVKEIIIPKKVENVENSIVSAVKKSIPGVVGITAIKIDKKSIFEPNINPKVGMGSGVIVNENGIILTNEHVAGKKNSRVEVFLSDGRKVRGLTIWSDPVIDLAVVRVNIRRLTSVPLGDSEKLQVGEKAIAIGNPLGLQFQRTVTSGIISALNRTIKIETENGINFMEDLIQTDAGINPGNSGGPLLNSNGEVIGINTIKVTGAEAIGFAIPINLAVPIIKQINEFGSFQEAYLGIFAYDREIISYIEEDLNIEKGVLINKIDENSPAYKYGLRNGSIITHMDDVEINTMVDVRKGIYRKMPGDIINIRCLLEGKYENLKIELSKKQKDWIVTR